MTINTIVLTMVLFVCAIAKALVSSESGLSRVRHFLAGLAETWISINNGIFAMMRLIPIRQYMIWVGNACANSSILPFQAMWKRYRQVNPRSLVCILPQGPWMASWFVWNTIYTA